MKKVSALLICFLLQTATAGTNSLQKGAQAFMDYCAGCHTLTYVSSERVKMDLGTSYNFKQNALTPTDARSWFGVVPPDLSLKAREKGADWLVQYFHGFYADKTRPFGTNNRVMPNVAMPNVFATLPADQYEQTLQDIVDFLVYTAEPARLVRYSMGLWVLGFLGIILVLLCAIRKRLNGNG